MQTIYDVLSEELRFPNLGESDLIELVGKLNTEDMIKFLKEIFKTSNEKQKATILKFYKRFKRVK